MAEVKISELSSATTPLAGTETVPIVQGGVTKKVAVSEIGGGASGVNSFVTTSSALTFPQSSYITNQINAKSGSGVSYSFFLNDFFIATPFIPAKDVTTSNLTIYCSSAAVDAEVKVMLFSDGGGFPEDRLLLSTGLSLATTGYKTYSLPSNYTFIAGTTYWFAIISKTGSGALSAISIDNLMPIGTDANSSNYAGYDAAFVFSYATPPTSIVFNQIQFSGSSAFPRISFKTI